MSFFVYILRGSSGELYIGQTNNLYNREYQQLSKSTKAAKYVNDGSDFRLVYHEKYLTRVTAMRRELQVKGWSRAKKEALIDGNKQLLKNLGKKKHNSASNINNTQN